MAMPPGEGGGAPALEMAIRARDETKEAFESAGRNAQKMQQSVLRAAGAFATLMTQTAIFGRVTGMLTQEQARFLGTIGTVTRMLTTTYYAAKAIAAAVTWAHNVALTWELALMTAGIGVAIAAAAAMAVLAMQTQSAADAQRNYNQQLEAGTPRMREQRQRALIRRGEWEEAL